MEVDVLHVPACPNLDLARRRLREALDATGTVATVRETEISTPAEAAHRQMRGSPTILIDGHDPFGDPGDQPSLSCRLYDTGGTIDGAPSVDQLIAVLEQSVSP